MIKTLYEIGNILQKDDDYKSYFEPWQIPFKESGKAIVLVVNVVNKKISLPIMSEAYSSSKVSKYLYRAAPGRATNLVPTFYFYVAKGNTNTEKWEEEQRKNIDKVLTKAKASIKNYQHDFVDVKEIDSLVEPLFVKSKSSLDADNFYLLTFKINGKYLGDFEEYRQLFYNDAYAKYHSKVYGNSKIEDYKCALTGKPSTVYGFVNTLGFTVNDLSFMRNGFNQDESYKMFPISDESVGILEGAMSFASNQVERNFYGNIKYLILPQFILSNDSGFSEQIISKFTEIKPLNLNLEKEDKGLNGFINETENYIQEIINEELLSGQVNYEILFLARNNSQIELLLHISDVLPSHLKNILLTKKSVEKFYASITNTPPKDKKKGYTFKINLLKIKDFFLTEKGKKKMPHPIFYRLTEAIFCNQQINKKAILKFFVDDFRKKFKRRNEKPYDYISSVREGFALLQFFTQIGLFHSENQNNMEDKVITNALDFIEQHNDSFFKSDYKKAIFLFGYLVGKLTYVQKTNAFLKRLNNLKIDKDLVNKVFPELIKKLRDYKKEYTELESEAMRNLASGADDKLSKDEISMAFTMGLVLQKDFDIKNAKK